MLRRRKNRRSRRTKWVTSIFDVAHAVLWQELVKSEWILVRDLFRRSSKLKLNRVNTSSFISTKPNRRGDDFRVARYFVEKPQMNAKKGGYSTPGSAFAVICFRPTSGSAAKGGEQS